MKSENDRRRGGNRTRERKEQFIREHFAEEPATDNRGLNRQAPRKFSELSRADASNLARKIEKTSKGHIPEGTAKRLVAKIRKDGPSPAAAPALSEKDRRRGEKLAVQLKTIRQARAVLEKKLAKTKEEESRLVKQLKTIGQPELFGV